MPTYTVVHSPISSFGQPALQEIGGTEYWVTTYYAYDADLPVAINWYLIGYTLERQYADTAADLEAYIEDAARAEALYINATQYGFVYGTYIQGAASLITGLIGSSADPRMHTLGHWKAEYVGFLKVLELINELRTELSLAIYTEKEFFQDIEDRVTDPYNLVA